MSRSILSVVTGICIVLMSQQNILAQEVSYKEAKKKAKIAMKTKSYKKAVPNLVIMLEKNPNDKKAHAALAKAVTSSRIKSNNLEDFYSNLKVTNLKAILPVAHKYNSSLRHHYAFMTYELVQNIDESEETSLMYLAIYTMNNHLWEKAYKYNYRRAKYLKDNRAFFYNEAGKAAMHWKHYKEAEDAFKEAIKETSKAKEFMTYLEYTEHRKQAEKAMRDSLSRDAFENNPVRLDIERLGKQVNSEQGDYSIYITPDESMMYFTSRRTGGMNDAKNREGLYPEDIYYAKRTGDSWENAVLMPEPINHRGHDANPTFSADGQTMIFSRSLTGTKDLYMAKRNGAQFETPVKLGFCDKFNDETEPSLSADGTTLYFSAMADPDKDPYNYDIYYTTLDKNGEWKKPKKLGGKINTEYNERAPFIHPDGKTLYFSSEGHPGVGGFDIFRSEMNDNGKWSDPVNVGCPLNTRVDDYGLMVNAKGTRAYYYSTDGSEIDSEDLFEIDLTASHKSNEMSVSPVKVVTGSVQDNESLEPLNATIELRDMEKNDLINSFVSNSETGYYGLVVPAGKEYGIIVKKEGYVAFSETFSMPEGSASLDQKRDIHLNKIQTGEAIELNIHFEPGDDKPDKKSELELAGLADFLREQGSLKIEIGSYTYNAGSAEANKELSEKRAQAVADYLSKNDIAPERISVKGYGDTESLELGGETGEVQLTEYTILK